MKVKFLMITIAMSMLIFSSCSEQKKAERFVKRYIKERINDPESYESVSFSPVEKVTRPFTKTAAYKMWVELFDEAKADFDMAYVYKDLDKMEFNLEYMNKYDSCRKADEAQWNPGTEYKITHTYRGKNAFGAVIKETTTYYIDSTFSVVTYTEEE